MFEGLKRWLGLQPKLNMHTVRMVHLSEQRGGAMGPVIERVRPFCNHQN